MLSLCVHEGEQYSMFQVVRRGGAVIAIEMVRMGLRTFGLVKLLIRFDNGYTTKHHTHLGLGRVCIRIYIYIDPIRKWLCKDSRNVRFKAANKFATNANYFSS